MQKGAALYGLLLFLLNSYKINISHLIKNKKYTPRIIFLCKTMVILEQL